MQVSRASDGTSLFSEGNDTVIAAGHRRRTALEHAGDGLALTLNGSTLTESFAQLPLQGGNVVIHMK